MRWTRAFKQEGESQSGIALFMVVAAMSILSVLVVEFTYVAQINQTMAFDALDQVKAHYLAKSGLKLSLLRIKAYQNVKGVVGGAGGKGLGINVPDSILEKIWSFPFFYPIPTEIPGLSMTDKDAIAKFQKTSNLDGKFSAVIESESSKYNLNLILAPFVPTPSPSPSASPSPGGTNPTPTPSPSATFDPQAARDSLSQYLGQLLQSKIDADPDFAQEYRDFKFEDFMENLFAWADRTYQRKNGGNDEITYKKAPFNSVTELHMIPPMEDEVYNVFAPALTASTTPGINLNTMNEHTLKAILPQITDEEMKKFFEFRDSQDEDNHFKTADDFFKWLVSGVQYFRNDQSMVDKFKEELTVKRRIRLVTEETEFKITVQATVNQSSRTLEAWVSLLPLDQQKPQTQPSPGPGMPPPLSGPGLQTRPESGLKITYMRVL